MKLTATFSRLFLVAIAVVLVGQQAFSQDIESKYKRYSWNSGAARNPMMTTKVIARHQVQIERGLGGFRLHFAKNQIGNGIAIQISTPADHQRFILTDKALAMYEYSTP